MTAQDLAQLKEILDIHLILHTAEIKSRFDMVDLKQQQMNDLLIKQNGRVTKLEDKIELIKPDIQDLKNVTKNHYLGCPNNDKITKLETEQYSKKEIKRFLISAISITSIIVGIIVAIIKYI